MSLAEDSVTRRFSSVIARCAPTNPTIRSASFPVGFSGSRCKSEMCSIENFIEPRGRFFVQRSQSDSGARQSSKIGRSDRLGYVNFYCRPRTMDSRFPSNFDPKSAVVVCSSCPKEFGWIENTQRLETLEVTDIYGQQLSDAVNIHARRQPGVMDLHTVYAMRNQQ